MERVHFISIGGSAMHNLAIALKRDGYQVTGSDDDIFDPSRTRLAGHGLLPPEPGWFPEKITKDIDYVILGMHARIDNPELKKAGDLGIRIFSFPEYIYHRAKKKKRVVIAGSHGKSTITSVIMHVMHFHNRNIDYLAGAGLAGFENMVKLTDEADTMILEGDEYFSSAIDKVPKFIKYHHSVGLVSGIAWDHINAFPSREAYEEQFEKFIRQTPSDGTLVFNSLDETVTAVIGRIKPDCRLISYTEVPYSVENHRFYIVSDKRRIPLLIFGRHNMQNLDGAAKILECLGISYDQFLEAIPSFPGAGNRLEMIISNDQFSVFRDFAHAPSKVRASVSGVRELDPDRKLTAFLELHTYSSLNPGFMQEYRDSLKMADNRFVYLNDHALNIKKMKPVSDELIREKFNDPEIIIVRDTTDLRKITGNLNVNNLNLLFMSSGSFGGLDLKELFLKKQIP